MSSSTRSSRAVDDSSDLPDGVGDADVGPAVAGVVDVDVDVEAGLTELLGAVVPPVLAAVVSLRRIVSDEPAVIALPERAATAILDFRVPPPELGRAEERSADAESPVAS